MATAERVTLKIHGMHCAGCVATVEKGLSRLSGVSSATVNLATNSAVVSYDLRLLDQQKIIDTINELGYSATVGQADLFESNAADIQSARTSFLLALVFAAPLMILAMWPMLMRNHEAIVSPRYDSLLQALLAALALFLAGRPILIDAFKQTIRLRANMNSLIALGTLTAFFWSLYGLTVIWSGGMEDLYFDSAAMIIALILLGRFLESRARGRAGEAIRALLKLRPAKALALFNNVEFEIDSATVRPGMILKIRPNERIAADGVILEGNPVVDESMLTGESMPVERTANATVIGGSLNGNTPFKMKVTTAGEDSYLAMVIRMVGDAQSKKAPVQKLADKVAGIFVPIVLGIAVLTLIAWELLAPGNPMTIRSVIAVLIIACPCALGLATPTAVLAGTGRAARAGILIRGGDILEKLSHIDTVIFDKTGTLTYGTLTVVNRHVVESVSSHDLDSILLALESHSDHPIAKAIVNHLRASGVRPIELTAIESKPGYGMTAESPAGRILIGNKDLMETSGVDLHSVASFAASETAQGHAVVYAAINASAVALLSLADQPRDDARAVVAELSRTMKHIALLSGDSRAVAENMARQIGIAQTNAEIRSEGKKDIVESYRRQGLKVAMVGDGINDAPALASADIGIAVGNGTDIAIESADVVLLRSDLTLLTKTFTLARKSLRVIKQNLFWAFFYNVIMIPVAAGAFYPVTGWTLSPMIAAAAMSCSSLFVVLNSLRLARLRLE